MYYFNYYVFDMGSFFIFTILILSEFLGNSDIQGESFPLTTPEIKLKSSSTNIIFLFPVIYLLQYLF